MPDTKSEPNPALPAVPARRWSFEAIVGVIIGAIILGAIGFAIANKVRTNHEIAAATVVADKAIDRIAKQDAVGLRNLGDASFQKDTSADQLQPLIKPIAQIYGSTPPHIDHTTVSNTAKADNVVFIYRYDRLKVPFYVRIVTSKSNSSTTWHMTNLGANIDPSKL